MTIQPSAHLSSAHQPRSRRHSATQRSGSQHRASTVEPGSPGTGGTDTLDRELEELLQQESIEPGDHERFSHYVPKEKILESAITGKPVIALCGKVWLPGRDPQKFPVCPTCKEIYAKMKK